MKIVCPECRSELTTNRVNVKKNRLICNRCGKRIRTSSLFDAGPTLEGFDIRRPPRGVSYSDDGRRRSIHASLQSSCGVVLFPVIGTFFLFIPAGFFLKCLIGDMNPVFSLFWSSLLLLGFMGTCMLTIFSLRGELVITIDGDEGEIFTGVGRIGRRKRFLLSEVRNVREEVVEGSGDSDAKLLLTIEGPKRLRFGNVLTEPRRFYVLQALRVMIGSEDKPEAAKKQWEGEKTPRRGRTEAAPISCPSCGVRLPSERITMEHDLVVCDSCDEIFALSKIVGADLSVKQIDVDTPPRGVAYRDTGMKKQLSIKMGTVFGTLFLVVFACLWNAGFTFGAYAYVKERGAFDIVTLFFSIPIVLCTALMVVLIFLQLFGKTIISIEGNEGRIFRGVEPFGRTRKFHCSEIREIREEQQGGGAYPQTVISLIGQTRIQFGAQLKRKQKRFVLAILRKMIVESKK